MRALPSLLTVGGVQETVAVPELELLVTVSAKEGSAAESLPSDTRITTPLLVVPAYDVDGVPESRPVAVLKAAQAGLLVMLNVSLSPLASDAVGLNE